MRVYSMPISVDKSDTSFTYYDKGTYNNRHGIPINAVPLRRKIGKIITDPRINNGAPFDQVIVEFWYNNRWVKLNRKNSNILYGNKLHN